MSILSTFLLITRAQGFAWPVYFLLVVATATSIVILGWLLALKAGFDNTMIKTGQDNQVLLLKQGAANEAESFIDLQHINIVERLPIFKKDEHGKPLSSPEIMALVELESNHHQYSVMLRGLFKNTERMRSPISVIQGRHFHEGRREVIIGKKLAQQLGNIQPEQTLLLRGSKWIVTGIFSSHGDAFESEIWADGPTLTNAMSLMGVQSVRLKITEHTSVTDIEQALSKDSRLRFSVFEEKEFFSRNAASLSKAMLSIIIAIGVVMGLAATVTSASGMMFLTEKRLYVFGLLRSIGYDRLKITTALLLEGLLITLTGIACGVVILHLFLAGKIVNIYNMQTYSLIAFEYQFELNHTITSCAVVLFAAVSGLILTLQKTNIPSPTRLFRR